MIQSKDFFSLFVVVVRSVFTHTPSAMATVRTSGATTQGTCNLNKAVPILDLVAGALMITSAAIWMYDSLWFFPSNKNDYLLYKLKSHQIFFWPYIFSLPQLHAFGRFSGHGGAFQSFLIWGWGIFFGITLVCLSLLTPSWIPTWFPFMQTFLGKGL